MKWIVTVLGLAFCLMLPLRGWAQDADAWAYDGPYGPQNWALLSDDYASCMHGDQQSPIDLRDPIRTNLSPMSLQWEQTDWQVYNTGRGLSAQSRTAGHMMLDGIMFELVSFQLHAPSEHSINGKHFPMEVQFVHVSKENTVAILSVMLTGGGRNPDFEHVLSRTPTDRLDPNTLENFDPTVLITDLSNMMRYQGSLTKPPCAEYVTWSVLTEPLVVSDAAITSFEIVFGDNARPIQPTNRRYILTGNP